MEIFLKNNFSIKNYLEEILKEIPEWLTLQNIIVGIVREFDLPKCKICGKYIKYSSTFANKNRNKSSHCSNVCISNDLELSQLKITNSKKTILEKYGVISYFKTTGYKEKLKQTSLERYGVENPSIAKEVKETEIVQEIENKYIGDLDNYIINLKI